MNILRIFSLQHFDLLASGFAVAAIAILGMMVFLNNKKSITSQTFLAMALVAILYGVVNYLSYQTDSPRLVLWLLRLVMFSAVWYSFLLFHLFYVFPNEKVLLSNRYKFILIPVIALTSLITLTPLVFSRIVELAPIGQVTNPDRGPGIAIFGLVSVGLVVGGLFLLFRKTKRATGIEKKQFRYVLIGTVVTYSLLIIFNLILPVAFNNLLFIPFAPVFTLPFVTLTAYAIIRHRLLNVKVIATEGLTFILAVTTLFEVILSSNPLELVFRSGVFLLVLSFGILLIKSVLREVEQREQLEILNKQLSEEKTKVDELSRFKTQLLSLASHQIKAPLGVIKQFATILIEELYGEISEKIKVTIEKMRYKADELINLINNLLDLRKVEEGKMEYKFEKVDLKSLVSAVVEELRPLATNGKNIELTFIAPENEVFVSADAQKLKQVIQNLVDNALKYTPQGYVHVTMTDEKEKGAVLVTIVDSGLGIPADLVPHLFEEFIRDERVKREIRGTGLGLFIARKMLEAHGGTLWAESEGEGKGSKFCITLRTMQ